MTTTPSTMFLVVSTPQLYAACIREGSTFTAPELVRLVALRLAGAM